MTFGEFNWNMKFWDSPTQGSPDILFLDYLGQMFPKRDLVDLSTYTPRTGKIMLGIKTFGCPSNSSPCKEYLQVKLEAPLQAHHQYYFEYWVCPIKPSIKVNSFGIALTKSQTQNYLEIGTINLQSVHTQQEIITGDSAIWHRISGVFETDDSYSHIVIGNFEEDEFMISRKEAGGLDYGYYLVDDVLVRPIDQNRLATYKVDEVITLEHILFEFDQAVLLESSKPSLDELVNYLQINQELNLEVIGHTDAVGTKEYNLKLSRSRANAIKAYLVEQGINASRVRPMGLGNEYPLVKNDSEENRQLNRRVEIKLTEL